MGRAPLSTLHCHCGSAFRGEATVSYLPGVAGITSDHPCPGCGQRNRIYRIEGDPEQMMLTKDADA